MNDILQSLKNSIEIGKFITKSELTTLLKDEYK